ncbi:uncharacterized protein LOC128724142 [Anopheles nili]|uniref:uncharacterized protein LOC128724142 n=1 Tax=Anopheles nili TaxID=185578 RepID=UPI00237C3DBB|nr:uncharacterized protein LOC128724142 [Anopheles nili]
MDSQRKPRNPIRDHRTVLFLIKQIKQHSCLWKTDDANYRNTAARKEAWQSIATLIDEPVPIIMRKWRSLCTSYQKIKEDLKKSQTPKSGLLQPTWFAYYAMDFLSKSVKKRRGGKPRYLILDGRTEQTTLEHNVHENTDPEEDSEEEHQEFNENSDKHYLSVQSKSTMPYNINEKLEHVEHLKKNEVDNMVEEDIEEEEIEEEHPDCDISSEKKTQIVLDSDLDEDQQDFSEMLEKRYRNAKRKSTLLYDLNEKLEHELHRHKMQLQQQHIKISALKKKLQISEQKLVKYSKLSQDDMLRFESVELKEGSRALEENENWNMTDAASSSPQPSPTHVSAEQHDDPLCNSLHRSKTLKQEPQVGNSLNRLQSIVEGFSNKINRRYSSFGEFIVDELNELDTATSMRLINQITSMLQRESSAYRNH